MIEWSESHQMIREAVRKFVETEIKPRLEELEHGDTPPYDVLRKMIRTFGMDEMARARFKHQIDRDKAAQSERASGKTAEREEKEKKPRADGGDSAAMQLIPIIELCRFCPGMVTAMGVSMGLTAASIMCAYSSTRRMTPPSMRVRPSSLKATAPAFWRAAISVMTLPSSPFVAAAIGNTRAGESCRARSRM